jgi:autotransporter-associated beta strand protein
MKRLRSDRVFLLAWLLAPAIGLLGAAAALGDSFTWQAVNGQCFVTPADNQLGGGYCWAFSMTGALEAKYLLTRNDPTFDIDLSEQNMICDSNQAMPPVVLQYETGLCTAAELPYTQQNTSPLYPLQPGWQQRVCVSNQELTGITNDIAAIKSDIKIYGPMCMDVCAGDLNSPNLGSGGCDHAVLVVGWVDNSAWAGGGYWICKNSWGTTPNNGYYYEAYANQMRFPGSSQALEGPAWFTGTMYFSGTDYTNLANLHTGIDATATWVGGTNKNVWDTSTTNWRNNGTQAAFTWVNQEVGATFDDTSNQRTIRISGTTIAHSLTFTGTGYSISGGALTVTAGGITANQSVTINSPVTVGAPQTWTVAAGQNLTVWGIHTVISDLTINAAGTVSISGSVDGGGVANLEGAAAGRIIQSGPGPLTFTSQASCADTVVWEGGTLSLGMTGSNFTGGLDLNGPLLLQANSSSTVSGGTLSGGPFGVGALTLTAGTLEDDGGGRTLATAVNFNGNVTLASAGSTGLTFAPLGLATPNIVTMSLAPTITVTAPTTIADQLAGVNGFIKCGTGTLTLTATGNTNLSGLITVEMGTLAGATTLAGPVTVESGAHLAPGNNTSGNFGGLGAFAAAGLTLAAGAAADMDLGTSSDLLAISGPLELDSAILNVQNSGGLTTGAYELISYGSLSGSFNPASLVIGSLPAGFCGVVVNNAAASQIDLHVYVPKVWTGSSGSAWNTTTANWSLSGATATYANGDPVLFNDTAAAGSVSVAGTVSPTTMMVNNNALSYAFSGSGCIAGSMLLTKLGGGTLVMNMANNTYTGGTILNGGVLQLGANSSVSGGVLTAGPLGTGAVFLVGGSLQDDGQGRTLANAVDITGNITLASAGSNGLTLGPQGLSTPNTITLSGSPTISVTAPTTIADQITGGALSLVMAGSGAMTLTAAANTYTGPTSISGGSLAGTVADLPTEITLANNANLTFNQNTGGTLSNYIGGVGSLTMAGTAVLTMGAPTAYLGPTAINAGTLQLTAAVPNPGLLIHCTMNGQLGAIATGGTIADVSGNGNTMTLEGGGVIRVAGQFGQAIQLNGVFAYCPNTTALSSVNSWTDSVWVNMSAASLSSWTCLMSGRLYNPSSLGFDTYFSGSSIGVEIPDAGQTGWLDGQGQNSVSISPNTWTMITQTVTTDQYQLYINGTLVGTQSFAGTPQLMFSQAQGFVLGGAGTGNNFEDSMDDFYLFNSVLSATEIQRLYQNEVLHWGSALPANSPVQLAGGAVLDLAGVSQTICSLSGAGTVTNSIAGSGALTLAPSGGVTTTFSGVIQDGVAGAQTSLALNGSGAQVLTGSNTYSGLTTIAAGTLQIGAGGAAGSINDTSGFVDNGTLAFNVSAPTTIWQNISGSGGLTQMGPGLLTLTGSGNYGGPTIISGGTLQIGTTVQVITPVAAYSFGAGTLTEGGYGVGSAGSFTDLSGNGNPMLINSWGGAVTQVAGPLAGTTALNFPHGGVQAYIPFASQLALNSWTLSLWFNPTDVEGPGGHSEWLPYAQDDLGGTPGIGFSANMTTSGLYVSIPSTTTSATGSWLAHNALLPYSFSNNNWYMITETVTAGTCNLYVNGAWEATLSLDASQTPIFMDPSCGNLSFGQGDLAGDLAEFKLYGGVLTASQIQTLYNGAALTFVRPGTLPAGTPVQLAGGAVLDLGGTSQTIGSLANGTSGGGTVTNSGAAAATLTLAPTGSTTFSGHIQNGTGQVALVLNGLGIQVLAASNTYTGGTEILAGTLVVANSNGSATGSGAVTLSGGTLASGAAGSISGTVTVAGSPSEIAPGGVGSVGELTVGSLATASKLTTLDFDLTTPGGSGDLLMILSGLTLAPSTAISFGTDPTADGDYRLIGGNFGTPTLGNFELPTPPTGLTYALSTSVDSGYIDLVVSGVLSAGDMSDPTGIPEPSALALVGAAAVGLAGWGWRRRMTRRAGIAACPSPGGRAAAPVYRADKNVLPS